MSREVSEIDGSESLIEDTIEPETETTNVELLQTALESENANQTSLPRNITQLSPKAKVALIRKLIAQLEPDSIQSIVEFGLKEIGSRHHTTVAAVVDRNTRLLLKKDYSYQTRGLSKPTQYFVYLRRRKPKLDRYIGALFHVPQGCALSYFLDAEERLIFNPPHNVFELRDSNHPDAIQVVRLICLEPPPPDYTFDKQQNDIPDIQLHLEYLHPQTYQPLLKQAYAFPKCMYGGGELDRYRWEVKAIELSPELAVSLRSPLPTSVAEPLPVVDVDQASNSDTPLLDRTVSIVPSSDPAPRRVLEVQSNPIPLYLCDRTDEAAILKRMRLWVTWSVKSMPQSRWDILEDGSSFTLMNARFKRRILQFSLDSGTIVLENSLPVLMKWFHDLSLAVSQSQGGRPYSAAQLKLAHTLFIEMSLPQTDPTIVLKKLFDVEFSKTETNKG